MKLSVIVPSYKFSKYIDDCLNSIVNQKTNFQFEILVRDDFSQDGSEGLIERIINQNSNPNIVFRYFKSSENLGCFGNIQLLLNKCSGEYIAYIDGDDYFTDEYKLQKQVDFLDENPEFSLHCTSCYYIEENGELVNPDWPHLDPSQEIVTLDDLLKTNLITFGRVFRNIPNILEDSFSKAQFVDYLINYKILLHGKAKCEKWVSGAYRHTNYGEITKLQQSEIDKQNEYIRELMMDNYNFFNTDFSQHGEQKIILDFFKNDNPNDLVFLDIGANDGLSYSNTLALSLRSWRGYCIEPSKQAFNKLNNLYKNNNRVSCYNVGISNETGLKKFYESRNWIDSEAPVSVLSSLHSEHVNRFVNMEWEETNCNFLTFEDWTQLNNLENEKFDFISIDCKGHDFIVLQQLSTKLQDIRLLCVESSSAPVKEIENYLSKFGFRIIGRTKDNLFFGNLNKKSTLTNSVFDGDEFLSNKILQLKDSWLANTIVHNIDSTDTIQLLNNYFTKQIKISNSFDLSKSVEDLSENTIFFINTDDSDILDNLKLISKIKAQPVVIINRSKFKYDDCKGITSDIINVCKKIFPIGYDYCYNQFSDNKNLIFITPKVRKKDVVIIDSFIFNSDIENKLLSQIDNFKSNGYDVILISNSTVNTDLMNRCDYFIYDSRNQLFEESYDNIEKVNFFTKYQNFTVCTFKPGLQRHGLSVLINLHNAVNFAKSLGYENFLRIEADDIFGKNSIDFMKSVPEILNKENKKSLLFYNDYENEYNISFHFMYFNIDHYLSKVIQLKNESDYRSYLNNNFGNNDFQIAEKYIYNNLKLKGDSEVFVLDGHQFDKYFPDSSINTSTSLSNLDPKYNGCVTTIYRNNKNENNVVIFSSNSTNVSIIRKINLVFSNRTESIEHDLPYFGSWVYHTFDKNLLQIEVYDDKNSLLYIEKNSNLESYVEFD
jgi:FkbM family methyltransferase